MAEVDVLRIAGSLLLVVALILGLAWLARRVGGPLGTRHPGLRLIATQRLGTRASLAIIEFEGQRLLIGVTAQQVSLLGQASPTATSPSAATDFQPMLDQAAQRTPPR